MDYYNAGYEAYYSGKLRPENMTEEDAASWQRGWRAANRHEEDRLDRAYDR